MLRRSLIAALAAACLPSARARSFAFRFAFGSGASAAAAAPPSTNLQKWWKLNTGLTQAGGFASAWADQIAGTTLVQATGAKQPAVQVDGSLLFDGVDDLMTATITYSQPFTVYLRVKSVTWTNNEYLADMSTTGTTVVAQIGSTPAISLYAGTLAPSTTALAVNTKGSLCGVFNGASSVIQVSGSAAQTGDSGVAGASRFTLGANTGGGNAGNVQIWEALVYNVAHDSTARAAVFAYLDTVSP